MVYETLYNPQHWNLPVLFLFYFAKGFGEYIQFVSLTQTVDTVDNYFVFFFNDTDGTSKV